MKIKTVYGATNDKNFIVDLKDTFDVDRWELVLKEIGYDSATRCIVEKVLQTECDRLYAISRPGVDLSKLVVHISGHNAINGEMWYMIHFGDGTHTVKLHDHGVTDFIGVSTVGVSH